MATKKKRGKCGYGFCFHGSFKRKADAAAKEKTRKGSFVISRMTQNGLRYIVMRPKKTK